MFFETKLNISHLCTLPASRLLSLMSFGDDRIQGKYIKCYTLVLCEKYFKKYSFKISKNKVISPSWPSVSLSLKWFGKESGTW